jgi:ATP-binding cassette subfamily C protein LapB
MDSYMNGQLHQQNQHNNLQEQPKNIQARKQDRLATCLLTISKLLGQPCSKQNMLAGLPLVNGQLNLQLLPRAAQQIGLQAKKVAIDIDKIKQKQLPAILMMHDQQPLVIKSIDAQQAVLIAADDPTQSKTLTLEALNENYSGEIILIRKPFISRLRENSMINLQRYDWFWHAFETVKSNYREVIVASLLINIFAIAVPLFILNVYDRIVPNDAMITLWTLSAGVLIVILFDFILRSLRSIFIDAASKKVTEELLAKIFAQATSMRMSKRPNSVGTFANTLQSFESLRDFISSASLSLVVDLPFVILFIAIVWVINSTMAIIPIIAVPIVVVVSYYVQKPLTKLIHKNYLYTAEKNALLVENLSGIETIKVLNNEGSQQRKWEDLVQEITKINLSIRALTSFLSNFSVAVQYLSVVAIIVVGVYCILGGSLTLGGLIACLILTRRAIGPMIQISNLLVRYKQANTSIKALDHIMQADTERPEGKRFIHLPEYEGKIQFDQVSLTYPKQPIAALNNVNLKIQPGEHVGLIGRTSSGKSSVGKLLLQLYQPSAGRILVDDVDINQIGPSELRAHIGYVPQNVVLFHGTIRDNIVMQAPEVSDQRLLEVAKISGVDQFVHLHPDGYDREVGEGGCLLSGGQKQAIALARAFLLDPDIFILDEPTNSLDNTTIKNYCEHLSTHLKDKTLILITHRSTLLSLVDRLIVLEQGKVIANGARDSIMNLLQTNISNE